MNVRSFRAGFVACLLAGVSGADSARAELPSLDDRKWVGCFLAHESKQYQFSVTTQGRGKIEVIGQKGDPVSSKLAVSVDFQIQETLPDGKVVAKSVKPETLESTQAATTKLNNIVIRGKVAGDAGFEACVSEEKGAVSVGGKLLEQGTLKNPLRFVIRVNFPDAYASAKEKKADPKEDAKKAARAFEQRIEKDRLQLKWTDGKSHKQDLAANVEAGSKEINGPGIAALSLEFSSYQEKKFILLASENSSMTLSNASSKPLNTGFAVIWAADPGKDPEGKARLSIEAK
ncbi:MAG: hypothetical protein ABIT37_16675 [Luteolibacter sp.]